MISPFEEYKFLMRVDNIEDIAYQKLFKNYIELRLQGNKKLIEINSTDQESLLNDLTKGFPIPGMVYTFIYPPKKDDHVKIIEAGKEKEYVDFVPLIFCVNSREGSFDGINLNTLPNIERLKFLNQFYEVYQEFFKDVERLTENNQIAVNMNYLTLAKSGNGQKLIKAFSIKQRANFNYGYRRYLMPRVRNFRMIEFCEWIYIPFYNPINAFKLLNLTMIHDLYWKTNK